MHEPRLFDGVPGLVRNRLLRAMPIAILPALALLILLGGFSVGHARAEDMSFRLVSVGDQARCRGGCPAVIAAEGEITDQTPAEFAQFVRSNIGRADLHAIVFLDSPGGKVVAAMELGRIWRRLGVAAIVGRANSAYPGSTTQFLAARCLSACVYALIGAKKRVIPPVSIVGVHRMFFYEDQGGVMGNGEGERRHYDNGGMKALLSNYTARMGVNPGLISMAEHIGSEHIHVLSRSEIARYRLGVSRF
jgi:hypothetical protein